MLDTVYLSTLGSFAKEVSRSASVGGNIIVHFAVVEFFIGNHVEITRSGETEYNGLFLAGFFALKGLVNGNANGVTAFGSGRIPLDPCKFLRSLENLWSEEPKRLP